MARLQFIAAHAGAIVAGTLFERLRGPIAIALAALAHELSPLETENEIACRAKRSART